MTEASTRRLRSQSWWDDADHAGLTAIYLERYLNYGMTRAELQSGRPVIGIAQSGSDLSPCNRHHLALANRVRDGIRDAGGVPIEFPVHPIQETGKRPTAALDRNLAYLGLVEILYGYPIDGVVLTTGCDKTTPAQLMAAATVDIPAIVLSGGPMLDGYSGDGTLVGSGDVVWQARERLAAGEINYATFSDIVAESAPSIGHCNTMGTASSLNALAEVLGMSLPGCAAIPAPYRQRAQMAYATGYRAVGLVREDLRPSKIMTREAFENAIVAASALGASTNCPPHVNAIARHIGVPLSVKDWDAIGYDVPLLVNMKPAGHYLAEAFYRAGEVPAVIGELLRHGRLHPDTLTVSGATVGDNCQQRYSTDQRVITPFSEPLKERAGFINLSGNLFDSALMKTSVISDEFHARYLSNPDDPEAFEARAIVFDGPEDYAAKINDPDLHIDEDCILVMRGCGPIGYPGSGEVVNMLPSTALVAAGCRQLPCLGDGRQSGTSGSPSILNASPEAAAGGGLGLLRDGDRIRIDLQRRKADVLLPESELAARRNQTQLNIPPSQTPWQELYRSDVGQLADGAVMESAVKYQHLDATRGLPRHNH